MRCTVKGDVDGFDTCFKYNSLLIELTVAVGLVESVLTSVCMDVKMLVETVLETFKVFCLGNITGTTFPLVGCLGDTVATAPVA